MITSISCQQLGGMASFGRSNGCNEMLQHQRLLHCGRNQYDRIMYRDLRRGICRMGALGRRQSMVHVVYLSMHLFESTFWRTMENWCSCGEPSVEAVLDSVGGVSLLWLKLDAAEC
jgi:hypothetical protein